jgi:hypothetical protein
MNATPADELTHYHSIVPSDHQFAGLRSPTRAVRIESFGLFGVRKISGQQFVQLVDRMSHIMFFTQAIR